MNTQVNNNTQTGGIGFIGLLTVLFIALKLTGVISWTWFWVLSPLIFSAGLGVILLIGVFGYLGYMAYLAKGRR